MTEAFKIISMVLAVTGFAVGLAQYRKGQKWKRAEFASRLLERLREEWALQFCCYVLDYSSRRIKAPDEYEGFKGNDDGAFVHTVERLEEAMKTEEERQVFEWPLIVYRDSFDRFFQYLENLDHYINIGLIETKDITPIRYWLQQVNHYRFNDKQVFTNFLEHYQYTGVFSLMKKFDIPLHN